MRYEDAVSYLYQKAWMPKTLRFFRIERLMELLGNPSREYKVIQVSGTNGKGSVSSMLHHILLSCGYKVGLNTSPHLEDWVERIVVNGNPISREDMGRLIGDIVPYVERVGRELGEEPTLFEIITAAALWWFERQGVEWAVVEVGIEGKYDATNVVKNHVAGVLVSLDIDHTKTLGKNVQAIAREARAVFRGGVSVVGPLRPGAWRFIRHRVKRSEYQLVYGIDFEVLKVRDISLDGTVADVRIGGEVIRDLKTGLIGWHQATNMAVAVATIYGLERTGRLSVDWRGVREGLMRTRWPGRFEVVSSSPLIVLDGAHNPHGMSALVRTLRLLGLKDMNVVFGVLRDKDYVAMVDMLMPYVKRWFIFAPPSKRSLDPKHLAEIIRRRGGVVEVLNDKGDVSRVVETSDQLLVTGSLYLVGDIRPLVYNLIGR